MRTNHDKKVLAVKMALLLMGLTTKGVTMNASEPKEKAQR
jgi:hypothetical protein